MKDQSPTVHSFPLSAWEHPARRSGPRTVALCRSSNSWIAVAVLLGLSMAHITIHADAAQQPPAQDGAKDRPNTSSPPPLTSQPQSPAEALRSFELPNGFRIELMAAEPLVQDPVAIQWGADGKLWVAEMADYPYGLDGKMSPGGRVRVLEDSDGDGKPDRSTIFLDHINFPTGVLPWRKGVLVTSAPDIFYAEDTDGDGKADVQKTLFTGFKEGNPQLRVNGLQWGLDGWVYCANGWSGGEVKCVLTGKKIDLKRYDFRFRPDTGELELISGITEFGRNRDDWGNWFGCDNSNPAWHFVLEERYLRRNPHVAAPDPRQQLLSPPNPHVFARSQLQKRYHSFEHADRFTSACAVTPYRDDLLFFDSSQHLFVCEPVHNLVQHLVLAEEGTSFKATVPEHQQQRDFLTSTDPWFRPVNLRTGPDGALWVVDMYRFMIEHPEWLPDEGKRELEPNYRLGEDRGRIYRVYREDRPPRRWKAVNNDNSAEALYASLDSPNGWQRDIAQQQFAWRQNEDTQSNGPEAARLAAIAGNATNPKARLQAIYTLSLLQRLENNQLLAALRDSHPAVRRDALRLAEDRLADKPIVDRIVGMVDDDSAMVRLQLACTLGQAHDPRAADCLAKTLVSATQDKYLTAAVFSSLGPDSIDACFTAVRQRADHDKVSARQIVELSSMCAALDRGDLVQKLIAGMDSAENGYPTWQIEVAGQWLEALKRTNKSADEAATVDGKASEAATELTQRAQRSLERILEWTRKRAADDAVDAKLRSACLRLSMRNAPSREMAIELAMAAFSPQTSGEVQRVAVQESANLNTPDAGKHLLERWRSLGPTVRQEVLSSILPRPVLIEELLSQLENGAIRTAEIDAASRQRLLNNRSDQLRRRAKLIFGESAGGDRAAIVREFQDIATVPAEAARGREIFALKCAACHALEGKGNAVGPNLEALTDRSTQGLLTAILDPSRAIEPKYAVYQAVTRDGRSYTGVLVSDTSGQIELVEQEGRRRVISRSDLEEITSSETSLMPEGFEKDLSRQQLADLIRYVQKPAAGQTVQGTSAGTR